MAKNRTNNALCVFLAAVLCLLICGCTEGAMNENRSSSTRDHQVNPFSDNEPGTFDGLSAKTEWQIKRDYLYNYLAPQAQPYLTVDDIQVEYYFGKYNGYEVIGILGGTGVSKDITVAGKVFYFPRLVQMLAWNSENNSFYDVQNAHTLGLLTAGNIQSISERHYGGAFEGLDAETERQMKDDFVMDPIVDYATITRYYGTYNGWVVANMEASCYMFPPSLVGITVAGIEFLASSRRILVWKADDQMGIGRFGGGRFYYIDEAYNLGFLNLVDIKRLFELCNGDIFEGLSLESLGMIRYDYVDKYLQIPEPNQYMHNNEIRFDYNFGVYNDCAVVAFLGDTGETTNITAAGTTFIFPCSVAMLVWKQSGNSKSGYFHTTQEAYDLGFLTDDNISSMYKRYVAYNILWTN